MKYLGVLVSLIVWTAWMLGSSLATESADLPPSTHNSERAKNLIVVVTGDLLEDNDAFDAGIIVGMDADYLYIATANHVVRNGARDATNLKVAFYFLAGEVDADLMKDSDGRRGVGLDLAMLRVDRRQRTIPIDRIPFDLLGDTSALQPSDGLYAIGHPEGIRWDVNPDPYRFERPDGIDLVFRSSLSIAPGHSGGGLFDEQWRLVGMVKHNQNTLLAVASSVDHILQKLEFWRYPITLRRSGVGDIRNTKIAFISDRDGNAQIYVMDIDRTNVRRLTNNTADDFSPAWSPDGRQIVFHSDRDGNAEIYVIAADGTNVRRLTPNTTREFSPAWSPDGTQIAFSSNRDFSTEIFVMDANGTNVKRLTNNGIVDINPAWSPFLK